MAAMKGEKVRLAFERLHYTVPVKGSTPKLLLQDIKGEVTSGHVLAILGPSGAGKSVLTRTIIGLVPKVAGRIEVFGIDLDNADSAARRGVERRSPG